MSKGMNQFSNTDSSWSPQSLQDDVQKLGCVLEQYRAYLRMLARSRLHQGLRGKVDPSDIVQEACVEAVRQICLFRGNSQAEFAGWLRGILADRIAKTARRYLGTQQRNLQLEMQFQRELDEASGHLESCLSAGGATPSEIVAWNETTLELARAIESLPEDYQQVVLLRNLQGLSFPEIASAMDRSIDSVEKLWIRALLKLKQAMKPSQGEA